MWLSMLNFSCLFRAVDTAACCLLPGLLPPAAPASTLPCCRQRRTGRCACLGRLVARWCFPGLRRINCCGTLTVPASPLLSPTHSCLPPTFPASATSFLGGTVSSFSGLVPCRPVPSFLPAVHAGYCCPLPGCLYRTATLHLSLCACCMYPSAVATLRACAACLLRGAAAAGLACLYACLSACGTAAERLAST